MHKRLLVASIVVALVGWSSALAIYLVAPGDGERDDDVQIVIVDGQTYRIPIENTKVYRRDLQRFGGTAAVLADDLSRSFAALWRGRSLGVTIACITAIASGAMLLLAREMAPDPRFDERGKDGGPAPGGRPPDS